MENFLRVALKCFLMLLIVSMAMPSSAADEGTGILDPGRVGWRRAVFHASKFLIKAKSSAELSFDSPADLEHELLKVDVDTPIPPAMNTARLTYIADGLGRHSETTLLMNPITAAAIQYETYEPGKRRRIYRFMETGAFQRTWRPTHSEEKMLPDEWTDRSEDFRPYPDDPLGNPVIDPIGLLFIIAAADFGASGYENELLALNRNKVSRIVFMADGLTDIDVNFSVTHGDEQRRCKGAISALHIRVNAKPYGSQTEAEFDFMGLQSDVSIFLDPETRLPLLVTGRAKIVGKLKIRLHEATTTSGVCPKIAG